jgi:UDP-glucose 4-epimerase
MTNVLVTGGTGFIGSALVKGLVKKGYHVSVFDNNFRGVLNNLREVMDDITFIEGDIRDPEAVNKSVEGIDHVYHLAFINGTENFYNHPDLVLEVGIKGHFNIMEAVQHSKVSNFIYASSSEIYQTPGVIPTPESIPAMIPDVSNPRYSYGGSKLLGEILTLHYPLHDGCKKKIFRPHNIYGPAMGFEHVIPQIVRKIYHASEGLTKQEATIEIQGSGEETRAFCYIDDAVDGIITMAEKGEDRNVYHLGKEEEVKIIDLVRGIGEAMGITLTIEHTDLQIGGTPRRCPDIAKLRGLGYDPTVSLKEGLQKSVDWYANYYRTNE